MTTKPIKNNNQEKSQKQEEGQEEEVTTMTNEATPSPDYNKELRIASLAVHRASILTKIVQRDLDIGPILKPDSSPVTVADLAAQAILVSVLRHHFPNDVFVGEESAPVLRGDPLLARRVWELASTMTWVDNDDDGRALAVGPRSIEEMLGAIGGDGARGQRTWILDPIDGMATFIRGHQYAVSVALVEDGEQKVGVVGCPNLAFKSISVHEEVVDRDGYGMMLLAVRGQGAYKRRMSLSSLGPLQRISLSPWQRMGEKITFTESSISGIIHQEKHKFIRDILFANPVVDLYSMQVKYAALAIGACNAMIRLPKDKDHRFPAWDHAGGMLIFEESGGKVTDLYGRPFNYALGRSLADNEGLVAAKSVLHTDLLRYTRYVYGRNKSKRCMQPT
ncbi:putative diphosphonucleoside phosphohydrolase [Aspergillus bombycis]|uniref:Putative diphosphonucleoside phosphohydrolase n=1 Tax=Aspergillus bombycis TaxID=109264 RepID=A0A1F7ZQY1_9EURO|nr:putative diphosphonucleoside phosphohydrolase [Aspergillus bombycis]OGM41864.1 putative diphosphonucleoside phosphohydrolase [Aspergillus bombycis]